MKKKTSKPSAEHLKADRVNVLNSAFDEMIKTIDASMRLSNCVFRGQHCGTWRVHI